MHPGLIGRAGEPYEMVVETGKIREFARAVNSDNAAYFDDVPVAPATFLASAAMWGTGPENSPWRDGDLDLPRIVHGSQEFIFHGTPPVAGERFVVQMRVADIYEKAGKRGGVMTFGVTVTEFRDADTGELRAESRGTVIETGQSIK